MSLRCIDPHGTDGLILFRPKSIIRKTIDLERVKEKAENIFNFYLDSNWEFQFVGRIVQATIQGVFCLSSGCLCVYLHGKNGFGRKNMENHISRSAAIELLKKYNKDPFHLRHALTVEAVMRWYAKELGYADEEDFWGLVGLLLDIDFEMYPEEHCIKAPELLREAGVGEEMIYAICSHAYGMHVDVKPEHLMEKVLFATDELTGLIWATALMRPSKSVQDMELKSLKKKYKVKTFAAGCSREVIEQGAEMLGWPLDEVLQKTLDAMKADEASITAECARL